MQADSSVSSLIEYRFKHHFKATRGAHGKGSRMHGADGEDVILKVPVGTVIREFDDEAGQPGEMLCDLTKDGDRFVVAEGGMGGRGNTHFVTSTRRAPAFAELGEPACECSIEMEMKMLADVALVGMPSAGKSSMIARMSAARPKIADYPFTTLVPNLGVAKSGDASFVIADVPGLIEGAHEGRGLGHEFLRHIERTAVIVHIVDMTGGFEGRDPVSDYHIINRELELYAPELAIRPRIVVANKMDALADTPDAIDALERLSAAVRADSIAAADGDEYAPSPINPKLFEVSALTGSGIESLKAAIATQVDDERRTRKEELDAHEQPEKVWRIERKPNVTDYQIERVEDGAFVVRGDRIERMVAQTDMDNEEAVIFLQHRFRRIGLDERLRKEGAHQGDEVRIGEFVFEYDADSDDVFEELDE